ncbi:hypothetical protein K501DRAFT_174312 [Backusella circina FSU 941]|nr:hypothetical protein K501DRAFT_174312 [Backusella circina FSU 941]
MDAPIEVLRIDQNTVSKELARFRPCDNETRCFYCREWALYIYKKHFVWNAKTQEDMTSVNVKPMDAGVHKVNFCEVTQVLEKKPKAQVITKQFEENEENGRDILDILKACQNWMTLPSAYSGLPNLFEQVEFNPFPDNIPLVHDEKDPSHMLDPLIIERQALCLPSDGFYLLKNLTSDILLSHSQPTCQHTKPESKLPSDLETDRAIFNENAAIAVKRALVEVGTALDQSWGPLNLFITQLKDHIVERNNLIGATGCQRLMDAFFVSQKYQPFVDYWAIEAPSYAKKKKGLTKQEISDLDRIVIAHFEALKQKADEFISQFVSTHLDQLGDLTTQLWKLIATAITEMNQRIHSLESLKEIQDEISKNKDGSANPLSAGDKKTIGPELDERAERFKREIDDLVASYLESNNRVEKLNNKEFKKRIKKVESGYYSLRQYFRTDVITKIFPEPLFCKFVVVCLESLMQEGELMESFTLHKKIKEFGDTYRDLQSQRLTLLAHFEEGVQTGRRELAGILGKLFLKEGMRIQGESLALKRQNNLLKSMGVAVGEEPNSKKKKKKKGTASTKSTATPPKSSTPTPSASDTPVEIPNNNPMVPDFVAEATPPPVKQEEEKAFIVEEPKEEVQPKKKKSATSENKKDKPVASPQLVKETKEKTKANEEWPSVSTENKASGWPAVSSSTENKASEWSAHAVENTQQQQPPSIPQDNSNDNAAMMNRPPGLPMNEMTTQPSNFSNNATTTAPPQQPTQFAAEPIATPAASVPDQTAAIAMLSAAQLQAPLPSNLDELGSDNLTLLARNLHNQNSQLIQTVYSMQSEITMMTRRYSDIITLTREKEQQTLQLLEARRQTDLEEARRYVLNLEARIKQLEYQTKITAGFGNQDLFAGYRDEMGGGQHPQHNNNNNNNNNNRRKMWSKHYSLRCGNCGQEGHASNDCTSLCRYCGNSDHLSDACPNNS